MSLNGGRLGVLAGRGDLPKDIIEFCLTNDVDCYALLFKGQSDLPADIDVLSDTVRLGQTQKSIDLLKKNGCTHIVFAGHIQRPGLLDLRPDLRTARFFTRLGLGAAGDDRLLRAIRQELEGEGFLILGAQDILPGLLTPNGALTNDQPNAADWSDIRYGAAILETISPFDIGQSCVVQQGMVLGIEAIEGTTALIERAGNHKRKGESGVLVKRAKAGQDMALDVPTIGEQTIEEIKKAGLKGIALEAERSQILNMSETVAAAEAAGGFIVGFHADDVHE